MQGAVGGSEDSVTLAVYVVPRAPRSEIVGTHGEALRIRLNAAPFRGAANAALITFVADMLGVARRQVRILSGHTSRHKVLAVSGLSRDTVRRRLAHSMR
jgi:uncharacterized protein (TIGR00251 family)